MVEAMTSQTCLLLVLSIYTLYYVYIAILKLYWLWRCLPTLYIHWFNTAIWLRAREEFADNRFQILFIYIDILCTWKFSRDEIFVNLVNDVMFTNI